MVPNESRSRRLRLRLRRRRGEKSVLSGIDYFAVSLCRFVALITTNYRQHSLTFHSDYALIIITMATDAHWLRAVRSRGLPLPVDSNSQQTIWMFLSFPPIYPCSDCNSVLYKPNDQIYSILQTLYSLLLFISIHSQTYTFTFAPIHTRSSISSLS